MWCHAAPGRLMRCADALRMSYNDARADCRMECTRGSRTTCNAETGCPMECTRGSRTSCNAAPGRGMEHARALKTTRATQTELPGVECEETRDCCTSASKQRGKCLDSSVNGCLGTIQKAVHGSNSFDGFIESVGEREHANDVSTETSRDRADGSASGPDPCVNADVSPGMSSQGQDAVASTPVPGTSADVLLTQTSSNVEDTSVGADVSPGTSRCWEDDAASEQGPSGRSGSGEDYVVSGIRPSVSANASAETSGSGEDDAVFGVEPGVSADMSAGTLGSREDGSTSELCPSVSPDLLTGTFIDSRAEAASEQTGPSDEGPSVSADASATPSCDMEALARTSVNGNEAGSAGDYAYNIRAMQSTNMLRLISESSSFLSFWAPRMLEGVPKGKRDCLDLAGKLPLCLRALDIGIDPSTLLIDVAQAGGVYGGGDGCLVRNRGAVEPIEIKGCICRRGKRRAFSFRNIRCEGTDWKHLFLLGRLKNPISWERCSDLEGCVWVGHVGRAAYEEALLASGRPRDKPMLAAVSPGCTKGWLGNHVSWVKLAGLDIAWWERHVLGNT
mmetsp:Transcript_18285/g.43908  ORF Transcript_18285/g.43908 Transcript_18285/m.43908 type:complete len:562 (-) Transcript_18285:24-1709(-)